MNLHLVTNNPVYIDLFINKAENLSTNENLYIRLKPIHGKNYVESGKVQQSSVQEALKILKIQKIKRVIIHFLDNYAIEFLKHIDSDIEIFWMFWGADGYRHPKLKKDLYLPKTEKFMDEFESLKFKGKIKRRLKDLKLGHKLNRAFSKIDYCCTQVKGDYDLIKSASRSTRMKHLFFSYNGINFKNIEFPAINSENGISILLGNSASPTNNHLDVLNNLINYRDKIDRIVCPLSYSGDSKYVEKVISMGEKEFGGKFIPLIDFLPYENYLKIVEPLDMGIFFHTRQQAYSNTLFMLSRGKKILMNERSPLFKMYKDFGVKNVYSNIEELIKSESSTDNFNEYLGDEIINEAYKKILN